MFKVQVCCFADINIVEQTVSRCQDNIRISYWWKDIVDLPIRVAFGCHQGFRDCRIYCMATYPNLWSGKEGVVHSWLAVHLGSPASDDDPSIYEEHRVYCRASNWWVFLCDRSLWRWLGTSAPMDKITFAKARTDDGGGGRRVTMDNEGHDLQ